MKEVQTMNNTKEPYYFYFYLKYGSYFDELDDELAGKVIKHICNYSRGIESEPPQDPAGKILTKMMKDDIDNAFKQYRVKVENGKKGGAPKGNKNATKNKTNVPDELPPIAQFIYYETSWAIIKLHIAEKKQDYNLKDYFSNNQIATIAACYCIADIDEGEDYYDRSIPEMLNHFSASRLCEKLKNDVSEDYDDANKDTYERYSKLYGEKPKSFEELFERIYKCCANLLKHTRNELNLFYEKCYMVTDFDKFDDPADFENVLAAKELFTDSDKEEIRAARALLKKQPKTT